MGKGRGRGIGGDRGVFDGSSDGIGFGRLVWAGFRGCWTCQLGVFCYYYDGLSDYAIIRCYMIKDYNILLHSQPVTHPQMHPQSLTPTLLTILQSLLQSCQSRIATLFPQTPFHSFTEQLNPETLTHSLVIGQPLLLNTASLGKFVRLLEIVRICVGNIEEGKCITKRNLYYQLEAYYSCYGQLDKDIRLVCQNVFYLYSQQKGKDCPETLTKNDLGIIASNRCIIYGRVQLSVDGRTIADGLADNVEIMTLPTCRTIECKSMVKAVVIVEKESFFYELASVFKQQKLQDRYLLISAKGYPDLNTRNLLLQLANQKDPEVEKFYYLGDYDVYGFDILLFYAVGDWTCKGILPKLTPIRTGKHLNPLNFNLDRLQSELSKFTKQDLKKIKQIHQKLQSLSTKLSKAGNQSLKAKVQRLNQYFTFFVDGGRKCELQLINECAYSRFWVTEMIKLE